MTEQEEKVLPYDIVEYTWEQIANQRQAEIVRIRVQHDQLLAALKEIVEVMPDLPDYAESAFARRIERARAAIKAAVEEKP